MASLTLQLRSTEVLQDLLPVRRVLISAQVGLELARQNLQRSTLANTIGSDETQDLTRSGHGQTVQFEAVGGVAVGDLALEVGGQVDDLDGVEGALLRADTASDAQALTDEGDLAVGVDFDTELAGLDDGAGLLALLATFLRLALVGVDNGDTVPCMSFACPSFVCVRAYCAVKSGAWAREEGGRTNRVSLSTILAVFGLEEAPPGRVSFVIKRVSRWCCGLSCGSTSKVA